MQYAMSENEAFRKMIQEYIDCIESEKVEPFWEYYQKYCPERLLLQFRESKTKIKEWDLIPCEQYHNLLKRYMENPIGARIPDDIVTNWIMLICKNLAQLISIEKFYGRCSNFPYSAIDKYYNIKEHYDSNEENLKLYMNELFFSGFYKWAKSPQGTPAWNDLGFPRVYKILKEYREDMDPGDKLILVNRCLDVIHGRGLMAEYFIEGGEKSLIRISGKK